jgi:hypothetical protein
MARQGAAFGSALASQPTDATQLGATVSAAEVSTDPEPSPGGSAFATAFVQASATGGEAHNDDGGSVGDAAGTPDLAQQRSSSGGQVQESEALPSGELSELTASAEQQPMPVLNLSYQATARMLQHLAPPGSTSKAGGCVMAEGGAE